METPVPIPKVAALVETIHCRTSDEFIDALSPRHQRYESFDHQAWIFRGIPDSRYELLPSALRPGGLPALYAASDDTNKLQIHGEKSLLCWFLEISDQTGLVVPEDTNDLRRFIDGFTPDGAIWPPNNVLSLMALAQHNGIATRLLDWSRNPYKAALFAANSEPKDADAECLCVWAFQAKKLAWLDGKKEPFTVISAPAATNRNVHAQEGLFTLAKHIQSDASPIDRRPFDEILEAWSVKHRVKTPGPWFYKITLPRSEADELHFDLSVMGVTLASLFPDFHGVARTIEARLRHYTEPNAPGRRRRTKTMEGEYLSYADEISIDPRLFGVDPRLPHLIGNTISQPEPWGRYRAKEWPKMRSTLGGSLTFGTNPLDTSAK